MTDDIVTRLRENCDTSDCVNVRSIALVKCDNCDAADEIERLRKERTYFEEMCSHIASKNFDANREIERLRLERDKLQLYYDHFVFDKMFPVNENYTEFLHPEANNGK